MPDKPSPMRTAIVCVLVAAATPAAANLPEPVRAMIQAARDTGDGATLDSVVRMARQTNPGADVEIDALLPAAVPPMPMLPLAITPTAAELRPVSVELPPPPIVLSGEGELGGFLTTGTAEYFGVTGLFRVSRERGDWKHTLAGRADYQETAGVLSREFFQLGYKGDWQVNSDTYAFGLAQYERDRLAGFYSRLSSGAGMGIKLANSDAFRVNLEGGPAVRHTSFTDGHGETRLSARGALGLDWRITSGLTAKQNASIYTEAGATSIESTTALDTKLMKKLSARLSHSLRYEKGPLANLAGTDTVTRASVVYSF